MFYKIGALETFAKGTRKRLRQSDFRAYKLIGWDPATFTLSKSAVETPEIVQNMFKVLVSFL